MFSAMPCITIEVGQLLSIRAPAMYSGTSGPGTLLIATFATCGIRSATRALPYSVRAAASSQGTPIDGKSVGNTLLTLPMVAFIAAVADLTWASRRRKSARCVPRLTRLIEAWLFDDVSPLARSEIGTAATSDLRGTPPCVAR